MLLPILESTLSINYTVMYDVTNSLLDQMAYRLALYLNQLGHASIFMPATATLRGIMRKEANC